MENLSFEIIRGKDLSEDKIKFMEETRIKEYGANSKDFRKDELDSIFFYVKNKDEILSFGMLKPITIKYLGEKFDILGIGAILSVKKDDGYGKILMAEILKYLKSNKKTGLGFCDKKNAKF